MGIVCCRYRLSNLCLLRGSSPCSVFRWWPFCKHKDEGLVHMHCGGYCGDASFTQTAPVCLFLNAAMSKEFGHLYLILFVSPCFRPCLSDTTCATKSCACRFNWWQYFSHLGTPCVSLYHESIWCLIISAVISEVAVSLIKCWVSHRSAQEKPPFLIFSFLLSSLSFLYVNCSTSSDSCQFLQSIHFPIQVYLIS